MSRFDVHLERWNEEALDAGETYERESDEGLTLWEALRVMRRAGAQVEWADAYTIDQGVVKTGRDTFTGEAVSVLLAWPRSTTTASRARINRAVFSDF